MKITKVSYQKTYSIGPYLTDRVGFEADVIEEIQSVEDSLSQLKDMADRWHRKENPHLYQESNTIISVPTATTPNATPLESYRYAPPREIQTDKSAPGTYLSDIQSATTLEELKTFKTIARSPGNEELYKAYNNRVAELIPNVKTK